MEKNKIYFISDCHLGIPNYDKSLEREKLLVKWLDEVSKDAKEIYLLGDIFDFWFEYSTVVPKGYVRLLGKLAEISDNGTPIHFFTGNHDMWVFGYLTKELNIEIYRKPISKEINGKKFFIGHGDGLGKGDYGYKFIKRVFANKICQWMFRMLHPDFGIKLALFLSRKSRIANAAKDEIYLGEDKEIMILWAKEKLKNENFDFFIFGHRHIPLNIDIGNNNYFINLGDWYNNMTYAVFDGKTVEIKYYK